MAVNIERDNGVAIVTMSRPEALNAFKGFLERKRA